MPSSARRLAASRRSSIAPRDVPEIKLVRSAVERALGAIEEVSAEIAELASLAKVVAGETLNLVMREMVQLHAASA